MASGPQDGLGSVVGQLDEPSLAGYHLLPSVRADLLAKLDRLPEARDEFMRAASMRETTAIENFSCSALRGVASNKSRVINYVGRRSFG